MNRGEKLLVQTDGAWLPATYEFRCTDQEPLGHHSVMLENGGGRRVVCGCKTLLLNETVPVDPAEATGDVTDAEIAAVEQLALDALAALHTSGGSTAPVVRWFQWKDNRGVAVFLELLRRVKAAEGSSRMAKHQELAARASLEELESRTIGLELQLGKAYTATDIHGLIEQAASGHDKLALDHRNTTAQIKAEALRRWADTFVPLAPAPAPVEQP